MPLININGDLGESFGVWKMGADEEVLPWISSANVACGFYAGDPRVMDATVRAAKQRGVGVGAHPSFPDRAGFGRRNMELSYDEAFTDILYQIGALEAFCRRHQILLQHVKLHGQLNNLAVSDGTLAQAVVDAVKWFDPNLVSVSYGRELRWRGRQSGLAVVLEVYADRAYQSDGGLVSRKKAGAVLTDPGEVVERAIGMVIEQPIATIDGGALTVRPDTICVHGDTPGAPLLAQRLRHGLQAAGVRVRPLREVVQAHH